MSRGFLLFVVILLAVAYPPLTVLVERGQVAAFQFFNTDAFTYLAVARHSVGKDFFTFDGQRPTNGFHPLWQWTLAGVAALLAAVPGFYFLAAGALLEPQFGSRWSFMNGMESPLSIFLFGILLLILVRGDALGSSDRRSLLTISALLTLLTLARLDDGFFLLPPLLVILVSPAFANRRAGSLLVFLALPVAAISSYLAYNFFRAGSLLPLRAMSKGGLGVWENLRCLVQTLYPNTVIRSQTGFVWKEIAYRTVQLWAPLAVATLWLTRRLTSRSAIPVSSGGSAQNPGALGLAGTSRDFGVGEAIPRPLGGDPPEILGRSDGAGPGVASPSGQSLPTVTASAPAGASVVVPVATSPNAVAPAGPEASGASAFQRRCLADRDGRILFLLSGGVILKALYNIINVAMVHTGPWYYAISFLVTDLIVARGVARLAVPLERPVRGRAPCEAAGAEATPVGPARVATEAPSGDADGPASPILVWAVVAALLLVQANGFLRFKLATDYNKHLFRFWANRAALTAGVAAGAPGAGVLEFDDGIFSFSLDVPVLHGHCFAADPDLLAARARGDLFRTAWDRGFRVFATLAYLHRPLPPDIDQATLDAVCLNEFLRSERERDWTFSVAYRDPVTQVTFIRFDPRNAGLPAASQAIELPFSLE